MRCKRTGRALPAIWKHPDIDGQLVSAMTRFNAWALVKAITGKSVDEGKFIRTNDFAWRERILSTPEALRECLVEKEDMIEAAHGIGEKK